MQYISRSLEAKLTAALGTRKVLFLLGARQVGKTTLIEQILQHSSGQMLNMDIEVDRTRLLSASRLPPKEAMKTLGADQVLIIDEAQRVNDIGRITKGWYDNHVDTKIVLLGSASINLLDAAASELTGRNEKLWLTPLLFEEVLGEQNWYDATRIAESIQQDFSAQLQALLLPRLVYGSYPEAYLTPNPEEYLTNLSSDYLLKDILTSAAIRQPDDVRRLLLELAQELGSSVSIAQLATRTKLSRPTVKRYLDLLEAIFVVFKLPAWHTDPFTELHKSTKYYFWDTGIKNALQREWTVSSQRSDMNGLWKNWVIAELMKRNFTHQQRLELCFWQSRNDSTVDLIIKRGESITPIDIRWDEAGHIPSRGFRGKYDQIPQLITPKNFLSYLHSDSDQQASVPQTSHQAAP